MTDAVHVLTEDELAALELHLAGLAGLAPFAVILQGDVPLGTTVTLEDGGGTPVALLTVNSATPSDGGVLASGVPEAERPIEDGAARSRRVSGPVGTAVDRVDAFSAAPGKPVDVPAGLVTQPIVTLPVGTDERMVLRTLDAVDAAFVTGSARPAQLALLPRHGSPTRDEVLTRYAATAMLADHGGSPGKGQRAGLVVLLTGLSGSGKSTLARALADHLMRSDDRVVTLLDGDEVRRHLSAGLSFSAEDRRTNLLRIAWVAALAARHGGIAICAPIAPYASVRAEMRELIETSGRLVLVHVSTPLEACEARDRKGLYARARAGRLPGFTGIDDPYEPPLDADVTVDTAVTPVDEAVESILAALPRR